MISSECKNVDPKKWKWNKEGVKPKRNESDQKRREKATRHTSKRKRSK